MENARLLIWSRCDQISNDSSEKFSRKTYNLFAIKSEMAIIKLSSTQTIHGILQ